jgi:peptide/nickel transport system substrate-binding protein
MRGIKIWIIFLLCSAISAGSQTLKYVEKEKPEYLDPIYAARNAVGFRILELVFKGLASQDENGNWVPELADSIPPLSETMVVPLKAGLMWPDGAGFKNESLSAEDITFSHQVYMDSSNDYGGRDILESFSVKEGADPSTVRFSLSQIDPRAIPRMSFRIMPRHVFSDTYIEQGEGYTKFPFGMGPYRVAENEDTYIKFVANAQYHRGAPPIENIELVVAPDDRIHSVLLLSNQVQLDPILRSGDIQTIDANERTGLVPYDSQTWFGFAYNCTNSFLQFREVRQALTVFFNREDAFTATFGRGNGELLSGPFTPGSFGVDPRIQPYPHDPGLGEQLLQDAQLIDRDGDGVREDSNGKKMQLRMVLSKSMTQDNKSVCSDFAQQLKKNQIDVQMDWQEDGAWYERVFFDRDYDITFVSWKFDEGCNVYPLFSSTQQFPGGFNIVEFGNIEVEKWLNVFRNTTDPTERKEAAQRLHQRLYEESPYTFLWTLKYNAGIRIDQIKQIEIHPVNFFGLIHQWEMK